MNRARGNNRRIRWMIIRFAAIFLIAVILFLVATDSLIRPVVVGYAENLAEIEATRIINKVVNQTIGDQTFRYEEYVSILRGSSGEITAVSADTALLNMLVSQIVLDVQNEISKKGRLDMNIPLGNISGSAYLIGRGPKIPMSLSVSNAVKHRVTSEFSDAGVNQTLHRIVLHISTSAFIIVPFYSSSATAEIQLPLAETVIVGNVPDAYTVVIESSNNDMAGDLFDYGADATN